MIGLAVVKWTPLFVSDEKVAPEPWWATQKDTSSQEGQRRAALTADRRGEQDRGGGLLLGPRALGDVGDAERGCPGFEEPRRRRRSDIQSPLLGMYRENSLVPHGT
jgi:hypothetical protein